MATDKPVVVRLASGAEYGLSSAKEAKRIYPGATIVRYQTGEPYDAPKPAPKGDADTKPPKKGAKK